MEIEPKLILQKIKDKIRERRLTNGYTQDYLAYCLKINQSTYHKIECGKLKLKAEHLVIISVILDFDLNEFKINLNK